MKVTSLGLRNFRSYRAAELRPGRELTVITVRYGAIDAGGAHVKKLMVDDAPVDRLAGGEIRPLVSVFLPDRLELVTGTPALRRAHLDQVIAALRPARAASRRAYTAALGQRNALIASIRAG